MIQAYYNELDGPEGVTRRLSVKGHANYAPAGQDIVCAGASILMQARVWMVAGEVGADCAAAEGPGGPRIPVTAGPGKGREADQRLAGSFELAKTGLALLAERYPDNLRFADTSRRGEEGMVDLQLFARPRQERRKGGPALSREQERQAVASGTMKRRKDLDKLPDEAKDKAPAAPHPRRRRHPEGRPRRRWPGRSMGASGWWGGCPPSPPGTAPPCSC